MKFTYSKYRVNYPQPEDKRHRTFWEQNGPGEISWPDQILDLMHDGLDGLRAKQFVVPDWPQDPMSWDDACRHTHEVLAALNPAFGKMFLRALHVIDDGGMPLVKREDPKPGFGIEPRGLYTHYSVPVQGLYGSVALYWHDRAFDGVVLCHEMGHFLGHQKGKPREKITELQGNFAEQLFLDHLTEMGMGAFSQQMRSVKQSRLLQNYPQEREAHKALVKELFAQVSQEVMQNLKSVRRLHSHRPAYVFAHGLRSVYQDMAAAKRTAFVDMFFGSGKDLSHEKIIAFLGIDDERGLKEFVDLSLEMSGFTKDPVPPTSHPAP